LAAFHLELLQAILLYNCQLLCFWWLAKTTLKGEKDGVMIRKPGRLRTGNTKYGQKCRASRCSQHQARSVFGERPRKHIILNAWFQPELWKRICHDLCSNIVVLSGFCNYSEWSNYCQWLSGHIRYKGASHVPDAAL
jgi:hypothetical protein